MRAVQMLAAIRVETGRIVSRHPGKAQADPVGLADALCAAGATGIAVLDQSRTPSELAATLDLVRTLRRGRPAGRLLAGGSVGGLEDVGRLLQAGADRAIVGTAALANPEFLRQATQRFGPETIVASMEVRLERRRGEETVDVAGDRTLLLDTETTGGWYRVYVPGGSTATSRDAISWASQCAEMGVGELMVTSIDPSGEASHYDLELIGRISESTPAAVLATGPTPNPDTAARLFTLAGGAGMVLLDAALRDPADLARLRLEVETAGVKLGGMAPRSEEPRRHG